MYRISSCLILFLLLVSGCQNRLLNTTEPEVSFGNGSYQLYPGWPAPARQLLQHVVWQTEQQTQEFLLNALLTEHQILLIAMSPLGQELWRLQLQHGRVTQLSGIEPLSRPEIALRILAEMQLALLPVTLLQPRLQQLTLTEHDHGLRRQLFHRQQSLLDIQRQDTNDIPQQVQIHQQYYQLKIITLQQDMLP